MKKTSLFIFAMMMVLGSAWAQERASGQQRINWSRENILISKPYYLRATLELDALTHDLKIGFQADKKQKTWAIALIKLDTQLDTDWTGIKIVYKADLPPGMMMYVGMEEDDEVTYESSWNSKPGEFATVTIPKNKLSMGKWCRKPDKNEALDVDKVKTVLIGASGNWDGGGSMQGNVEVKDIVLVK